MKKRGGVKNHLLVKSKILVVGMPDSVHFANWLSQFSDSGLTFRVVPSSPFRRIHPKLQSLFDLPNYSFPRVARYLGIPLWLADRLLKDWARGLFLALESKFFRPDLVHVNEFQNAGYMYLKACQLNGSLARVPLILTPYGSDIFWFSRFPTHRKRIEKLLARAWGLSSECQRDQMLALKHGFKGEMLPIVPAFGQAQMSQTQELFSNREKLIVVKGYQNKWGRAINALRALFKVRKDLQGFSVLLYSCNFATIIASKVFALRTGIQTKAIPKGRLSQEDLARIFRRAIVYIGLSRSDGISASMIEAMANGAIPIQSSSSCCDEWMDNGVGGHLVHYDDISGVSERVVQIIRSQEFQLSARQANISKLLRQLDPARVQQAALSTYLIPLESLGRIDSPQVDR